jgi:hypothetical protein
MKPDDLVMGEQAARALLIVLQACREAGDVVLGGAQWAHIDPVLEAIALQHANLVTEFPKAGWSRETVERLARQSGKQPGADGR